MTPRHILITTLGYPACMYGFFMYVILTVVGEGEEDEKLVDKK